MSDQVPFILSSDLHSSTCQGYDWQPIDTAPKDGTPIDVWVAYERGGKLTGERWPDAYWGTPEFGDDSEECWRDDVCDKIESNDRFIVTHWRPIPKGPGE